VASVSGSSHLRPETRIVVTGGTGFLGTHLMAALAARGYQNAAATGAEHYDLTREPEVERMLAETRPQTIIHLAAVVRIRGASSTRTS
jgi:GDP-L-fucose synthase